jgi:zeaxanthin glucosyltransferase
MSTDESGPVKTRKIAVITLPGPGNLNPMTTLARRLQSRGHHVVVPSLKDTVATIEATGLKSILYGEEEFPSGRFKDEARKISRLEGEEAVRFSFEFLAQLLRSSLEQLPEIITKAGIDALVVDTTFYYVGLVPMRLGLPYVHISPGVPLDLSGATPPRFFGWPFETTPEALQRNLAGVERIRELMKPCTDVARAYSERMGMDVDWSKPDPTISKLAWIVPMPREFDFPSGHWPPYFHYTGPFLDDKRQMKTDFPWNRLTGEPLIYASMGTLQNGNEKVFQIIADAAEKQPGFQLALAIGTNIAIDQIRTSLAKTIVVNNAPQLQLLKQATLCITHAGMNTALECLAYGVPMVAIPVTNDQPAVAARIAYHQLGEVIHLNELSSSKLQSAINHVVSDSTYQSRAKSLQKTIGQADRLDQAAEIIETSFSI